MSDKKNERIDTFTDEDSVEQVIETTEIPKQKEFYKIPRRFGSIPVDEAPLGCNPQFQYQKLYPRIPLPFQQADRVTFGHPDLEPNRLIWGDNLHVMRMLPSNSIDLIYIDPPFFSGRNYNVIFGDQNEKRSFTDIWEGGMPSYLIWLNARLLEMKRLLKSTGSIYVHLDYHASHYVKIELDKIFGYDNFRNEVIWKRTQGHPLSIKKFESITDVILIYGKTENTFFESVSIPLDEKSIKENYRNKDEYGCYTTQPLTGGKGGSKESYMPFNGVLPSKGRAWAPPRREKFPKMLAKKLDSSYEKMNQLEKCYALDKIGVIVWSKNNVPRYKFYLLPDSGKFANTLWDEIKPIAAHSKEKVGYPTQKPEALLERIINASTNEGDVVADFFCGGGTTGIVAQKMNRKWILADQSRVAIAVTQGRLETIYEKTGGQQSLSEVPDTLVEYWGTYEIPTLEQLSQDEFADFIVTAFGGRESTAGETIHGYKRDMPIFVGSAKQDSQITKEDVISFAEEISKTKGKFQGVMLGWSFAQSARAAVEKLINEGNPGVDLIQISLTDIDSPKFREHVTKLHNEYESYLKFILPPEVIVNHKRLEPLTYEFDTSESIPLNEGSTIINVQWDFEFLGRFTPTQGFGYGIDPSTSKPLFNVQYKFKHLGKTPIACRVQDDLGGEKIYTEIISVK